MWHANLKTSWAQPNPNLAAYNHCNKVNTHLNAWNIVIMHMWCNVWCFKIKYTKPIPKFCKNLFNFEKPKIFQQIPKVGSQKMKCMKKWMRKSLTKEKKWSWDRRTLGEEVWSDLEVFWEVRRQNGSREIERKWSWNCANHINRKSYFSIDRELSRIKNTPFSYWGAIQRFPHQWSSMDRVSYWEVIEHPEDFSMDRGSYWELSRMW